LLYDDHMRKSLLYVLFKLLSTPLHWDTLSRASIKNTDARPQ
jgi:hypothetical protein